MFSFPPPTSYPFAWTSPFRWVDIDKGLYFSLSSCRFRHSLEKLIALSRSANTQWRTKFPVFLLESGVPGLYLCRRMIKSPRLTSARDRPIHSADAPPLPHQAAWIIYAQYRTWKRTFTPTTALCSASSSFLYTHPPPPPHPPPSISFLGMLFGGLRDVFEETTMEIRLKSVHERRWDELYKDGWRMDPTTEPTLLDTAYVVDKKSQEYVLSTISQGN